jgi:1-acyl-sn-glycerol-3-phosphate acyltransferase
VSLVERVAAAAVTLLARAVTGVRANWVAAPPEEGQRIYFANHASHGDFLLVWCSLPPALRRATRPVAAADYWRSSRLRHFFGARVFQAVLIERVPRAGGEDPIAAMTAALDAGASLLVFPEGTRNQSGAPLLPFKSGLHHVAEARPGVDLVPVWIQNLNRVLPKGEFLPVPLLCTVSFGPAIRIAPGETRAAFLARARAALLALAPPPKRAEP